MATTIYIHAGMHKTGTSSIQSTFFNNRRWLLNQDINYLSISENHSTTLYPLLTDNPHRYHLNVRGGLDTEHKAARRNRQVEAAFRRALASNTCSRLVISGEDLLLLRMKALAALKARLEPFATELRVLIYVREPYASINSAFQERLRRGHKWEFLTTHQTAPRYQHIGKFIRMFGRDRVDIRIFDRAVFKNGDLIADFLSAIGADPRLSEKMEVIVANEKLSHEAALILGAINRHYPLLPGGKPNPKRAPYILEWLRLIEGQPFQCPIAVFKTLHRRIARDVAWLNKTLENSVFSADLPDRQDVPTGWSEEAISSLGIMINELGKRSASSLTRRHRLAELVATWRS